MIRLNYDRTIYDSRKRKSKIALTNKKPVYILYILIYTELTGSDKLRRKLYGVCIRS